MSDTLDDLPQPDYEGTVAVDDLETDGDNPNEMSDEQFGLLCDRMRQNGWLGGPVVTNTEGLIADGEHRWRAAQKSDWRRCRSNSTILTTPPVASGGRN